MCGIAGFLDPRGGVPGPELEALAGRMADALAHRGPDDRGTWADPAAGVALGFRRLAIQDLSPAGHQPMASADGRYTIVFNGEVYNFKVLRAELEALGSRFRGGSDTEVLLEAFSRWGVAAAVPRFVGMFAFALWDARDRVLHLARDQMGIKPLYWGVAGGVVLFGSELKALRAHPAFVSEVDRDSLALFMRDAYIESPRSIWRGIAKLEPGTRVAIPGRGTPGNPVRFWSPRPGRPAPAGTVGTDAEVLERLDALLLEAVGWQTVADVPVGAFLSGGVDSSLVVALMQQQATRPVRTFSIGFAEPGWDEAGHARAVAAHLGTDHTAAVLTGADALDIVTRLPVMYDEPLADASAIPTYLVSKLARERVTVSLSGDGGDELFGGYRKYAWGARLARWHALPAAVRRAAARGLGAAAALTGGPTPGRVRKAAAFLAAASPAAGARAMMTGWADAAAVVPGAAPPRARADADPWVARAADPDGRSFPEWMMAADLESYMPDDILAKVDRASMAVSLEARVPLLDHRVAEFACALPLRFRLRGGTGKWALKELLARRVPRALWDRPKQGFAVPVGAWLRGPLRDWAEDLLGEARLAREGYLKPAPVRALWAEHLGGRGDHATPLWNVLTFQAWLAAG